MVDTTSNNAVGVVQYCENETDKPKTILYNQGIQCTKFRATSAFTSKLVAK